MPIYEFECRKCHHEVEQLILKFLYNRGEMLGRDLARELGLDFSLIDEILESLKRSHTIGVRKSLGMGNKIGRAHV